MTAKLFSLRSTSIYRLYSLLAFQPQSDDVLAVVRSINSTNIHHHHEEFELNSIYLITINSDYRIDKGTASSAVPFVNSHPCERLSLTFGLPPHGVYPIILRHCYPLINLIYYLN